MGQAKRRGTYEQRVAQAIAANATLEAELREDAIPRLRQLIDKHGVQRFRMSMGMHIALSALSLSPISGRSTKRPTGQENHQHKRSHSDEDSLNNKSSQT